ncbi:MAG TPA: HAD family phosphatase [Chroococcales cyanobacterium]|jgi:beta-phosphoglucomutase
MKTKQDRAVLWDLDGTLLDSADNHWLAWQGALAELGLDLSREQFLKTFGQRGPAMLDLRFPLLEEPEKTRLLDSKRKRYRDLIEGQCLFPGAREWLEKLQSCGWHQALASSSPRGVIEPTLEKMGIASFFEAIVAGDDVVFGKPDPEVFRLAAKKMTVSPDRCVVVEDAPAGIEAARRAGMHAIGIRSSHADLEADFLADSLVGLPLDAFDRVLGSF